MRPIGFMSMPSGFPWRDVFLRGRPVHAEADPFRLRHPAMDCGHRAKIFSPFDALKGFGEEIALAESRHLAGWEQEQGGDDPCAADIL